jgi:hypothetical protein
LVCARTGQGELLQSISNPPIDLAAAEPHILSQETAQVEDSYRVGSRVRRVYDAARTPFERVRECLQADPEKVAKLEELRKRLDPFQISRIIERKLERISRLANRRLSPKAEQPTLPETEQQKQRANGCGKAATLGNPANHAGFPLSHSHNNNKPSVTFQTSRQHQLRLHS